MFNHGHMNFMGLSGKAVGRFFILLLQNLSREALSS